jgi:hypothetical protein
MAAVIARDLQSLLPAGLPALRKCFLFTRHDERLKAPRPKSVGPPTLRFAGLKIAAGSVDDGGEKKGKLMAAEGKPVGRKKRGRRTTGHDALTTIRLSSELRESVDAWAAKQSDKPARPEAILRLVELGLETTHRRESLTNRAAKASQMAAQEIDRLSDPSTTDEERQLRKRRLIKGPKEFRNIRKQSRED